MTNSDPFRERAATLGADLRSAVVFLTAIPGAAVGLATEQRFDFRQGARIFPIVGALIGAAGGFALILGVVLGMPALVTAALAVTVVVLATGALHEDGLADTADGFGGGGTPERKLAIMGDSRIGTFGAVALILSLGLRVATLAALVPAGGIRAATVLIAAEAASRGAMVRLWHDLPAARPGGMSDKAGPPDERAMLVAMISSLFIVIAAVVPTFGLWAAIAASATLIATAFGITRLSAYQIGGQTGDTLGACQQCTAIAFLIAIAPFA